MAKRRIGESSGNIFADIGLPDAEELSLKAELAIKLGEVMRKRGLSQTMAAALTGISQPDLSRVLRGHLRDMSADRLFHAITHLEGEIAISIQHDGEPVGEPIVLQASSALAC